MTGHDATSTDQDSTFDFQRRLKILLEIGTELARAVTLDDLCRQVIELGCRRLGFDRLGLWFLKIRPV